MPQPATRPTTESTRTLATARAPMNKPTRIHRVLLVNPFTFQGDNPNIGMDPVVSRHAGQEIKTGVTLPIGLCYMAAVLLEKGFEVKLLDPLAEKIPVRDILEAARWSDAIITPFSAQHVDDIQKFMGIYRDKLRILVGTYAKHIPEKLFGQDFGDIILASEPEFLIAELLQAWPGISQVNGILYYDDDTQRIVRTTPSPPIANIDSIPFPARFLVNPKNYWDISFFGEPTTWLLPTRGCPYSCNFCAQFDLNEKAVRYRSPKNIADEIDQVVRESGVRNFVFFDETFNLNAKFVSAVCEEILARQLNIRWWCAARADLVKRDVVRLMKKAGCIEMRFGLESANDEILKYLQKDLTVEGIRRGCTICNEEGMNFSLQCILGTPMETEATIANTMQFIKDMRPLYVSFNVLTPLPGSQLFNQLKDKLDLDTVRSFDILHTNFPFGKFSGAELDGIVRRCYLGYYFSPTFLLKIIKTAIAQPHMVFGIAKTMVRQARYLIRSIVFHTSKDAAKELAAHPPQAV